MRRRCCVSMPCGCRLDADGHPVDFDSIFEELVKPALDAEGVQVSRSPDSLPGNEIEPERLQDLLAADLVVADLSLDHAQVSHDLEVRHALNPRGVVLIHRPHPLFPYDRFGDARLIYGLCQGRPAPATVASDRARLAELVRTALKSRDRGTAGGPPQFPAKVADITSGRLLWESYRNWAERLETARRRQLAGDILVLSEDAPAEDFRAEAAYVAADALGTQGQFGLALEQLDRCLEAKADHLDALRQREFCLQQLAGPASDRLPRRILLFSGHMVDGPGRASPRFPLDQVPRAERAIAQALDHLKAGPDDLGLTQGANGGDLIFAEACQTRGVPLQLLQPFCEPDFIERSVLPGGADWLGRYRAVRAGLRPELAPRSMPAELGESARNPYERCNLWLLYTALAHGPEQVTLVCLWDGGGSDGPGGTQHMVQEVQNRRGRVVWLDTRDIFHP